MGVEEVRTAYCALLHSDVDHLHDKTDPSLKLSFLYILRKIVTHNDRTD